MYNHAMQPPLDLAQLMVGVIYQKNLNGRFWPLVDLQAGNPKVSKLSTYLIIVPAYRVIYCVASAGSGKGAEESWVTLR
nr:hypothetical protein [Halomonas sp. 1513]